VYIKSGHTRTEATLTDEEVHAPYDRCMQYTGSAILQLRTSKMISPFVAMDDAAHCRQFERIPQFRFDPRTLGFKCVPQLGTNTPGFWMSTRSGFVSLSILHNQIQNDTQTAASSHAEPHSDRAGQLLSQAIVGSFGVLRPEACHLGFGPFNDPSRPLATQTILTDGQRWKLAVYQLNKTQLMAETTTESVNNVCWHLPEMKLFEHKEATVDGRPAGIHVDKDVLSSIVAFYLMQPTEIVPAEAETLQDVRNNFNRESFFEAFRYSVHSYLI
jgi:small subunit ribosomal protein S30